LSNLINPLAVLGLIGFYGCGSLVIREVSILWRKGWVGVLLLGLAYGVVEEGISTKTFVDPTLGTVGLLGAYGRLAGISWVFAITLTLFHAVFSIAIPILLVELLYPSTKGQRFMSDRWAKATFVFFVLTVAFGYFAFDPRYFEGYAVLLFFLLIIGILVLAAYLMPAGILLPSTRTPNATPRQFLGLGVAFSFGWSFLYLVAPHLITIPIIVDLGLIAVALAAAAVVVRWAGLEGNEVHKVMFVMGVLAWYIPWDFIVTFALADYGVCVVLLLVYIMLYRLRDRWIAVAAIPRS
jgi:hypothetical protein